MVKGGEGEGEGKGEKGGVEESGECGRGEVCMGSGDI